MYESYIIPNRKKIKHVYVKVTEACEHIYSDQTGQFPVQSSRGYKYILILYDVDSNAIISHHQKQEKDLK